MIFLNMDEAFTFLEEVVYPSFAELIQKTAFPEKKPIESAAEKNLYNLYNDTSMEKFFSESLSSMPTLTKRFITLSHTERSKRKCFSKDLEPPQNINLTPHVLALERFRDVSPALVIAVYEDSLVLEPGDVGPLPLSHPIAQELIRSINEQTVSFPMFQKLKDSGAPFYDGNIVFGIVDYRRCAFHSLNSQPPGVQQRPHLFTPGMTSIRRLPEIHKVLLRIPYEVLSQDIHTHFNPSLAIEAEKKIILATSTAICLDPDPIVFKILTTANLANRNIHHLKPESLGLGIDGHPSMNHYDSTIDHSSKIGIHLSTVQSLLDMLGSSTDYGTDHQSFKRAEAYLRETFKEPFSGNTQTFNSSLNPQSNKKIMSIGKESTGKPCLIKLIESWRFRDTTIASEPFYGLDARKDPSLLKLSAAPTLTWLPPGRSLWRTLRYSERKSSSEEISTEEFTYINRKIHITMHILASPNRHPPPPLFQSGVPNQSPAVGSTVAIKSHYSAVTYEVMLRIGNSPCTAEFYRKSVCFSTSWRPLIEIFVEQFKRTMSMEGRVCLADVANPGVINAAVATSTGQVPNINRAGPFAPISTGNSAIPMGPSVTSYQISSTNSAIPGATQRATLPIYYNGSNNPPPLVSNAAPGGSTINPNPMMQGRGTVIQAPSSSIMFAPNMNPNINIKLQQSGGTTINLNPNHSIIPTKNINFIPGIQAGQVTRRGKSITKQQKEIKASHRTINNTPPAT